MKNWNLLVWLTQLGVSVAVPLGLCIWLGVWLRNRFAWGNWIVILTLVVGIISAIDGLWTSLRAMERTSGEKKREDPPVSYNDHH